MCLSHTVDLKVCIGYWVILARESQINYLTAHESKVSFLVVKFCLKMHNHNLFQGIEPFKYEWLTLLLHSQQEQRKSSLKVLAGHKVTGKIDSQSLQIYGNFKLLIWAFKRKKKNKTPTDGYTQGPNLSLSIRKVKLVQNCTT